MKAGKCQGTEGSQIYCALLQQGTGWMEENKSEIKLMSLHKTANLQRRDKLQIQAAVSFT